jgi:hypothetical protein
MKLRVAIALVAAICLGSPALASSTPEEQMVKGRGARDRSGGGTSGAERRDGGGTGSGAATARSGGETRGGGERRAAERQRGDEPEGAAEQRGDDGDNRRYAVPKASGRHAPAAIHRARPTVVNVYNTRYYRPRYYAPAYYHNWARSYYRWSPISYAPWPLIYGSIGFSNYGFYTAFGTSYPYAPYAQYAPYAPSSYVGGIRLKIRPRDAQVFVDGYYAGLVDDFDGTFQSLRLEQGGHKIEIHMPGFEDLELDVHVQPGRTITLSETMRPRP